MEAPPRPSFVGAIVLAALAALAFAAAPLPWPVAVTAFAALAFAAAPWLPRPPLVATARFCCVVFCRFKKALFLTSKT